MTEMNPEFVRERISVNYPQFFSTIDNGFFMKSLDEPKPGEVIEHEGQRWLVQYSWPWWKPLGVQIYCAELEPEILSDHESRLT